MVTLRTLAACTLTILVALASVPLRAEDAALPVAQRPVIRPVIQSRAASGSMMLAVAHAGRRLVAVGERGIVLLSDDGGASFRQARSVPAQATLSSVTFINATTGWAAGQWGVILATRDGGESWVLQRSDTGADRPLFSVLFTSEKDGWAVGLWSLLLATHDGGATWAEVKVPPPAGTDKADLNLYAVFPGPKGALLVAGEQGKVLRSTDGGQSWVTLDTGYPGTLWTGATLADGTIVVGGLRGTILRSTNGGERWSFARTDGKSSVTGLMQMPDGAVVASALDGVTLTSTDNGASFTTKQRDDRLPLTAVTDRRGDPLLLSKTGPVMQGQ
jgi:photosystem II stability/assembly factor-like uncharacterized protein